MTRTEQAVLHLARVKLEAVTPLSITSGQADNVFDTALVRDANGLPAIPGSALAGVLRHLWSDAQGAESAESLFGYQARGQGQRSRLSLTWGVLLDSQGRAADGLFIGTQRDRLSDAIYASVLAQIEEPVFRDRVRLTHKGAAADTGKFDRTILPAGHRFVLELRLWSAQLEDPDWQALLDLFAHPGLRLGGATRAGLGRMHCVSLDQGVFDLRTAAGRDAFLALDRELTVTDGLQPYVPQFQQTTDTGKYEAWLTGVLRLEACGLWRIGQGSESLDETCDKPADLLPVVEERITWSSGTGQRTPVMIVLPGSSLKGALAHRMSFHARRLSGQWNTAESAQDTLPAAVTALLGEVKDTSRDGQSAGGRAGVLFIDDASMAVESKQIAHLMHNAIDRFTGAVREHVLYEEESLFGGQLSVQLSLDLKRLETIGEPLARPILRAAFDDLCQGRLALGSRTSSGNGVFAGELKGPLAEWLTTTDPLAEETHE